MKEKPCSMEVPSIWKCLPGDMLLTVRLILAGPDGCMSKGSTSHSSSSTKSFWNTGLGHRGIQGQSGVTQAWPRACHISQVSSRPKDGVSSLLPFLQGRQELVRQGQPCPAPQLNRWVGDIWAQEGTEMSP